MESWKLGRIDSLIYRAFDGLRNGLNKKLAVYLYSFVSEINEVKIVEAGSGPGFCASLLSKKENVVRAGILDVDHEVIKLAKQRDNSIEAVQGNILEMPFPDNSFDLVYNSSTIEHIDNYKQAFYEMVRVCKPGGYIFVGVPYKYGPLLTVKLFPEKGGVRKWVGKFIPRDEFLRWTNDFSLALEEEIFYFFRFFKGFLFKKK